MRSVRLSVRVRDRGRGMLPLVHSMRSVRLSVRVRIKVWVRDEG